MGGVTVGVEAEAGELAVVGPSVAGDVAKVAPYSGGESAAD